MNVNKYGDNSSIKSIIYTNDMLVDDFIINSLVTIDIYAKISKFHTKAL